MLLQRISHFTVLFLFISFSHSLAQITSFPYSENFDTVTSISTQWSIVGFKDTASSPRSKPNCIYAKGNKVFCTLTSPICDFTNSLPNNITFWESRTKTAVSYRLRVSASTDGINFDSIIAEYDTISSTSTYIERTIDLSNAGLEQQPFVQFQWQLIADSTNTTGVLRLDDFTFTAFSRNDLSISNFSVSPYLPNREDSFSLSVVAKNLGMTAASGYSVAFFLDANNNGIAELPEQFATISGPALARGDSAILTVNHAPMHAGQYNFIAVISLPMDGNHFNDTVQLRVQ